MLDSSVDSLASSVRRSRLDDLESFKKRYADRHRRRAANSADFPAAAPAPGGAAAPHHSQPSSVPAKAAERLRLTRTRTSADGPANVPIGRAEMKRIASRRCRVPRGLEEVEITLRKAAGEHLGIKIMGGTDDKIADNDDFFYISHVSPGTAAAASGALEVGDRVVWLNGVNLIGVKRSTFRTALKSAETEVVIRVRRPGPAQPRSAPTRQPGEVDPTVTATDIPVTTASLDSEGALDVAAAASRLALWAPESTGLPPRSKALALSTNRPASSHGRFGKNRGNLGPGGGEPSACVQSSSLDGLLDISQASIGSYADKVEALEALRHLDEAAKVEFSPPAAVANASAAGTPSALVVSPAENGTREQSAPVAASTPGRPRPPPTDQDHHKFKHIATKLHTLVHCVPRDQTATNSTTTTARQASSESERIADADVENTNAIIAHREVRMIGHAPNAGAGFPGLHSVASVVASPDLLGMSHTAATTDTAASVDATPATGPDVDGGEAANGECKGRAVTPAKTDASLAERCAVAERDNMVSKRDTANAGLVKMVAERDGLLIERDTANAGLVKMVAERDGLMSECKSLKTALAEARKSAAPQIAETMDAVLAANAEIKLLRKKVADADRAARADQEHIAAAQIAESANAVLVADAEIKALRKKVAEANQVAQTRQERIAAIGLAHEATASALAQVQADTAAALDQVNAENGQLNLKVHEQTSTIEALEKSAAESSPMVADPYASRTTGITSLEVAEESLAALQPDYSRQISAVQQENAQLRQIVANHESLHVGHAAERTRLQGEINRMADGDAELESAQAQTDALAEQVVDLEDALEQAAHTNKVYEHELGLLEAQLHDQNLKMAGLKLVAETTGTQVHRESTKAEAVRRIDAERQQVFRSEIEELRRELLSTSAEHRNDGGEPRSKSAIGTRNLGHPGTTSPQRPRTAIGHHRVYTPSALGRTGPELDSTNSADMPRVYLHGHAGEIPAETAPQYSSARQQVMAVAPVDVSVAESTDSVLDPLDVSVTSATRLRHRHEQELAELITQHKTDLALANRSKGHAVATAIATANQQAAERMTARVVEMEQRFQSEWEGLLSEFQVERGARAVATADEVKRAKKAQAKRNHTDLKAKDRETDAVKNRLKDAMQQLGGSTALQKNLRVRILDLETEVLEKTDQLTKIDKTLTRLQESHSEQVDQLEDQLSQARTQLQHAQEAIIADAHRQAQAGNAALIGEVQRKMDDELERQRHEMEAEIAALRNEANSRPRVPTADELEAAAGEHTATALEELRHKYKKREAKKAKTYANLVKEMQRKFKQERDADLAELEQENERLATQLDGASESLDAYSAELSKQAATVRAMEADALVRSASSSLQASTAGASTAGAPLPPLQTEGNTAVLYERVRATIAKKEAMITVLQDKYARVADRVSYLEAERVGGLSRGGSAYSPNGLDVGGMLDTSGLLTVPSLDNSRVYSASPW